MSRKAIGFRVPQEWYNEIQQICDERGISVSDFLLEATANALVKGVNAVNRDLPLLENQRGVQNRLTTLEQSLTLLTKRLTGLEQQGAISRPFPQPMTSPLVSLDELQDDEPDEILTDFLQPEQASPEAKLSTGEEYTLKDICDHYGISYKNFTRNAEVKSQSKLEYLRDQTGVSWVQRGKRYVPLLLDTLPQLKQEDF